MCLYGDCENYIKKCIGVCFEIGGKFIELPPIQNTL